MNDTLIFDQNSIYEMDQECLNDKEKCQKAGRELSRLASQNQINLVSKAETGRIQSKKQLLVLAICITLCRKCATNN